MQIIENTDNEYPKSLLSINNAPKRLYAKGNINLLNNKSLAIVGSRNCSEYGIKYAKEFAKEIADNNITIISGLAIGIDSVAHEIAKDCIGNTIAVLGCGINNIYPEESKDLFNLILENDGCVISEYEPEAEVCMSNFPTRNRIISGIANGILVVESRFRSGSNITAKYGFEQNKKVYCLPRDIGITNGVGTNNLIKMGAKLVTTPEEILQEFDIDCKEEYKENELEDVQINNEYRDIYNLINYVPKSIHYITAKSGLEISQINKKLTMLELQGYIKSLPGNNYVRK